MHIVLLGGKDLLLSPLKRSPMTSRRYALRDDLWQRIEHLVPGKSGIIAVTTKDKRLFSWQCYTVIVRTFSWRDLPNALATFG